MHGDRKNCCDQRQRRGEVGDARQVPVDAATQQPHRQKETEEQRAESCSNQCKQQRTGVQRVVEIPLHDSGISGQRPAGFRRHRLLVRTPERYGQ